MKRRRLLYALFVLAVTSPLFGQPDFPMPGVNVSRDSYVQTDALFRPPFGYTKGVQLANGGSNLYSIGRHLLISHLAADHGTRAIRKLDEVFSETTDMETGAEVGERDDNQRNRPLKPGSNFNLGTSCSVACAAAFAPSRLLTGGS